MRHGFPPVIIRKKDRLEYYQYLVMANDGDIRPFVRFIGKCAERTLDAYIHSTSDAVVRANLGLVPFGDESETIIGKDSGEDLQYHEQVIMGGIVGDNITLEP